MERNNKSGSKLDTRRPLNFIWPVDTSWIDAYAQPRGAEIPAPIADMLLGAAAEIFDELLPASELATQLNEELDGLADLDFIDSPTADFYYNPDEVAE